MAALREFQEACEDKLEDLLATHGRTLDNREVVQGQTQRSLTARIEGTELPVWIYEDEAEFSGEGRDCRYQTPDYDRKKGTQYLFVAGGLRFIEKSIVSPFYAVSPSCVPPIAIAFAGGLPDHGRRQEEGAAWANGRRACAGA